MSARQSYRHGLAIEERFGYVQGTVADLVYVAGQVARGPDGRPLAERGLVADVRGMLANLDAVLAGLGSGRRSTVFVQTHVTVPLATARPLVAALHRDAFIAARPAAAVVQVDALNHPDHLVETFVYALRDRHEEPPMPLSSPRHPLDDALGTVPARRVGATCFVSAQLPVDAGGRLVGAGDVAAQLRQVVENIGVALAGVGCALDDVVSTQAFLTRPLPPAAFDRFCAVHRTAFDGANRPAGTMVYVPGLPWPGALVQMSAVAWAPR